MKAINNKIKYLTSTACIALGIQLHAAQGWQHQCATINKETSLISNTSRIDYLSSYANHQDRVIELISTNPKKIDIAVLGDVGTYGTLSKNKYSFKKTTDFIELKKHIQNLLDLRDKQKLEKENAKLSKVNYQTPLLEINDDIYESLNELNILLDEYKTSSQIAVCEKTVFSLIAEIVNAINNNYTEPVVSKIFIDDEFLMGWLSHINEPGQNSRQQTVNITDSFKPKQSTEMIDPQDSPLWKKKNISVENTQIGFGRKNMIKTEGVVFKYDKPKTGFGTRPGIRIKQKVKGGKDLVYKVRIDIEAKTGPFLARLGNAIGYSTYALDYANEIEMEFTTKFFLEYHSRKSFGESVYVDKQAELGNFDGLQPVIVQNRQREWNPFEVVISATMQDGSIISGEELKNKLYKGEINKNDLSQNSNYDQTFAEQIKSFKIGPVSLELMNENEISVGSWGFNSLGHHDLREARGLTLLAAWLSLHDLRKDNTRLMIIKDENNRKKIEMRLSDWGSGLGTAQGHILGFKNLQGDLMADKIVQVDNKLRKVNVLEFRPNQPNFASDLMNYDDAKWMAYKIGQITESQLDNALAVSGFSSAEFLMYKHKLINRRNNIIKEFGLENQFELIKTNLPINFSDSISVKLIDGTMAIISHKGDKIVNGKLVLQKSLTASQDKGESTGALFKALGENGLPRLLRKILLSTPDHKIGEIAILTKLMSETSSEKSELSNTEESKNAEDKKSLNLVSVIIEVINGEDSFSKKAELTRKTVLLLSSFGAQKGLSIVENLKLSTPKTIWFIPNPAYLLLESIEQSLK